MKEVCDLCGQESVRVQAVDEHTVVDLCATHANLKIKEITLKLGVRRPNDTEEGQGLGPDGKTPRRTIRVPDDLWEPAKAKAEAEGTDISVVARMGFEGFLKAKPRQWTEDTTAVRNPAKVKAESGG